MLDLIPDNPLLTSLACAVLQPGLRSILVFDAPYNGLQQMANALAQMARVAGQSVLCAQLGTTEQDDDLWGQFSLPHSSSPTTNSVLNPSSPEETNEQRILARPLLFSSQNNINTIPLIVIPDLNSLSLAAMRACVTQIGAEIVHLERNGQSDRWQTEQYWLASCKSDEVGALSPHLLDRFAIRLAWSDAGQRAAHTQQEKRGLLLRSLMNGQQDSAPALPPEFIGQVRAALHRHVQPTPEAVERIIDFQQQPYHRRELALARYALALAQLQGNPFLIIEHVERAATLLGLQAHSGTGPRPDEPHKPAPTREGDKESPGPREPSSLGRTTPEQPVEPHEVTKTVRAQESTSHDLLESVLPPAVPYLEDQAPILREEGSLRLPFRRLVIGRADHGPIVGIEPGDSLRDLALVSTILHAALFRRVRRQDRILFTRADLRRHRRGQVPEQMLLILLDYTSLRGCNWQEAILPYLSEAYVGRASITIIKVGASDAEYELQATSVGARSILVPRIGLAFEAQSGRATPLAHGLDLARQSIHRALQHGRSAIQHAILVVISDGRGNVPLAASRANTLTDKVGRQGIEDALEVARSLRDIKHVTNIVLNPQPERYVHLPELLAEALGAEIIPIAPLQSEVEASV